MQHKFTPTTHLKRAALTLLALILTCATAWAQTTQSVTYMDENGQTQTVNATQITSDNLRMYSDRWYYVSGTVDVSAPLRLMTENGTHNLILCDGATLTVSQISQYNSKYAKLKVYGQSGGTGKLNVGNVSMMNAIFNCDFALYGGEVTLTYYSSGHGINMNVDFNGGKLTATSGANAIGGNTTINATSGWIKASKYGGSVTIAEGKYMKDETGRCYKGTLTDAEKAAAAGKTLQPATQTEYISYIFGGGNGSQNSPYLIGSTESWNYFCNALLDNNTWNHFSGKTVKLGANISITQSAGSAGNEFMGTFNGDGKTLTVDITETTTQGTAPFREIKGATIQNLVVTGSVIGTIHAAGLVGFARGADASTVNTITNCKVATNVTVTTPSGNNYHCGGVVGHAFHCTLNMSNTVYCGDITNSGNYVGGLQGWSDGNTINFSHCLFAGSYSGTTTGTASFHPVAVRYNNSATTADVSHVYYTATPTLTNSNYIAADGTKTISRATAPATIGDQTQSLNFMSTNIYQYGICYNNLYYATIGLPSGGTDIYLIDNADDWLYFCEMLNDNDTWNRFSGKTVKLGADISVSRMAGNVNHDFTGTFDGNGHTLTFNHTAADNYCAPFRYVQGSSNTDHAIIQNLNVVSNITAADYRHPAGLIALQSGYVDVTDCNAVVNINCTKGTNNPHDLYPAGLVSQSNNTGSLTVSGCTVSGTITTDGKYAAGMVGIVQSSASITNSVSSVTINSSTSGDGTHSGFVASLPSGRHLTIEGCVFNGKIVTTNGTTNCGGFLGHNNTSDGTGATITNCLYAPAADPNTVSTGCATFGRNVNSNLISNCYYTTAFGDAQDAQGTQAYSITAGEYVTLANAGTVSDNYTTSGLTFYNAGLKYGDVLYAASNDEVSLTLAHQDREGYDFIGYTATAGNLNGSSLTMPDGNVTINAEYTYTAPSELTVTDITFTTATLNWNGLQESYNVRYRTVGANEWQTIGGIAATTTTLSGLLSGTTYEWQVQGLDCDGEGSATEWSEAGTFTTLNPCETPYNLTATDITATTATLSWSGVQDSYNVRYRGLTLGDEVTATEDFEHDGDMPEGWTMLDQGNVLDNAYELGISDDATQNGTYCFRFSSYYGDVYDSFDQYLISPELNNLTALSFYYRADSPGKEETFRVGYSTTTNDVSAFTWVSNMTASSDAFSRFDANNIPAHAKYFAINYTAIYLYYLYIDDITYTYTPLVPVEWDEANTNVTNPITITGLTPETQYQWQVQGLECNGEGSTTEWSEMGTFTTLAGIDYIKEITAHGTNTSDGGWYLIASPVGGVAATDVVNLVATTTPENPANFDLYRFNQATELEWENWKQQNSDHYHFNLEPGIGYLYANAADVNLVFAGTPYSGNGEVTLQKTEGAELSGWNLVGNPFTVSATLTQPYYRMNAEGTALKTETENTPVAAMEGVFVKANEDGEIVTFGVQTRGGEKCAVAALNISLSKLIEVKVPEPVEGPTQNNGVSTSSTTLALDNAIIRFDGGQTLEKFSFRKGSTKIYIPQDGKDYAIATSNGQGEMPVNFKAKENGTYTLTVSTTLNSQLSTLNFNYLHLIDNMTGANVDLLASPTYTFTAKTTDYESRFKLVFSTTDADGPSTGSDTFAFISNGNLIVNGEGTLQIFDVLGHQLVTKQLSTLNSQLSTLNYIPGVYMLRLINGNDVRTQKMVVR